MPEGDTIHRLAQRLNEAFEGRRITSFQSTEPHLERADVVGRRFERALAQGKHLYLELSDGLSLHCHLQMRGRWKIECPACLEPLEVSGARVHGEFRPAQVRLATTEASCVGWNMRILAWQSRGTPGSPRLGPDLLAEEISLEEVVERWLSAAPQAIAEVLLRQDLAAGIGNVYKSETLFLEGIHPLESPTLLGSARLLALATTNRRLLQRNLGPGPRRTRFSGRGGPRLWVYERAGERCLRCGSVVVLIRQGAKLRSTYLCPTCQERLG